MSSRPLTTLLRSSQRLLAKIAGRDERPAQRVRHLFRSAPPNARPRPPQLELTQPAAPLRPSIAPARAVPAPRALAAGSAVDAHHFHSAYPAPKMTGALPRPARAPQTSASTAAISWPTAGSAETPALRDLSRPAACVPAPIARPSLLARPGLSHAYHRIETAPPVFHGHRRPPLRGPHFHPPFERGTVPSADSLEKTLRFQPSRTAPVGNTRSLKWPGRTAFVVAALLVLAPTTTRADSRPDFNRDAKPILRTQPQLLHYVKVHFDVQETGYARTPGDDSHAPPPPYIFRAKPRGAGGPYTITLFIEPGPPGHVLYVKKTGPLAAAGNPPAASYPPGDNNAPFNSAGDTGAPASTSSENAAVTTPPNGFVGVDSSTPSGPIKAPSGNATAPDLTPPAETAPNR